MRKILDKLFENKKLAFWIPIAFAAVAYLLFSIRSKGLVWNRRSCMVSRVSVHSPSDRFHTSLCDDSVPQASCGFHPWLRRDFMKFLPVTTTKSQGNWLVIYVLFVL